MKSKFILFGRWLAVLPTFILAYFVTYFFMVFVYRFWADDDSWIIKYVLPIFGSFVAGIFSMTYAAKIAPSNKQTVAFVILLLMVLCTGGLLFAEFFIISSENRNYVNVVALITSMAGNIIGYGTSKIETELERL